MSVTRLPFAPAAMAMALILSAGCSSPEAPRPAAVVPSAPPPATPENAFQEMAARYEAVRQALAHDTTAGVPEAANGLATQAAALAAQFDAAKIGVAPDKADAAKAALPDVAAAARRTASAGDIKAARAAFGDLSDAMVKVRASAVGWRPAVAYCPMADKSWLQPLGEIGNPYYGSSMLRCGTFKEK